MSIHNSYFMALIVIHRLFHKERLDFFLLGKFLNICNFHSNVYLSSTLDWDKTEMKRK